MLLLLIVPAVAAAQEPVSQSTVNEVASELYCPLCPGLTVDVCELEVCADMRAVIAERLEAGEGKEEIKAYFVEQYGQQVLGKPSTRGFDLTAWLIPFVTLGGIALAVAAWVRSRTERVHPSPSTIVSAVSPEYEARLDRELQRLEE